jgi:hypothetical protein
LFSKVTRNRYIVTGPDGCGKSTFIKRVTSNESNFQICYLGKRRKSCIAFNALSFLRIRAQNIPLFSFATRMFFFVIELIDLWVIDVKSRKQFYLIERHYFDRIAYLFQLQIWAKSSFKRRIRFIVEWPILTILNLLYLWLFAQHSFIRVILANPVELYARKPEDYASLAEAELRGQAYLYASNWWTSKGGSCEILLNNSPEDLDELLNQEEKIIRSLQNEFYRQDI